MSIAEYIIIGCYVWPLVSAHMFYSRICYSQPQMQCSLRFIGPIISALNPQFPFKELNVYYEASTQFIALN